LVDAINVLTSGCKSKPYILSSVLDIVNGDETNPLTYLARMEHISNVQEAVMAGILGISSGEASTRKIAHTCSTLGTSSRMRSLLLAYLKIITKKE
jgi:carboxypeptidase C (cathepsin A)